MEQTDVMDLVGMRAGEMMLASGAEVFRAEDTVHRILKACGAGEINVFALPTGLFVSVKDREGQLRTFVRRIGAHHTSLSRIIRVNAVSRNFCCGRLTPEDAVRELDRIACTSENGPLPGCAGYILTAGFFAFMFGGGVREAMAAAAAGVILYLVFRAASVFKLNDFIQNAAGAFAIQFFILCVQRLTPGKLQDGIVVVSAIMPMVPGVVLTTGIRDIFHADYSSGTARLAEAAVIATAVASGVGFALALWDKMGGML